MTQPSVQQPLAGITVLDFGQIYNGPYCGFLLAMAGARVIKIESPQGESLRGRGIGKGLLLASLEAMRQEGYGYAVIGGVGPKDFYAKVAGAVEIPDSTPGIYRDLLKEPS